jgi:hypothetical protein
MKKYLAILLVLLFAETVWADPCVVVVGQTVAGGVASYIHSDDFNRANTNSPETGFWDSETDASSHLAIVSNALVVTHSSTADAFLNKDLGGNDTEGWIYFTIKVNEEGGLGASKYMRVVYLFSNANAIQGDVTIRSDASQNLRGIQFSTAGGADPYYYFDMATDTEYPVCIRYKVGNPGAAQLFVYTGGDWQAGTNNSDAEDFSGYDGIDHYRFGMSSSTYTSTTLTFTLDDFRYDDTDPR